MFGRIYDGDVLDMFELSLTRFDGEVEKTLSEIDEAQKLVFMAIGDAFEFNTDLLRIRNFLHDFMVQRQKNVTVDIDNAVKYTFVVQALNETTLQFNLYRYNKAADAMEKMNVEFEGKIGRRKLADNDRYKKALEKPKKIKVKAKRNIEEDELGDTVGRIHVQQDNLKSLRIKKIKKRTGDRRKKPEEKGKGKAKEVEKSEQ